MNDSRDLKAIAEVCQQHQPLRFMRSHGSLYIRNDNGIVFDVHQNRSFPEFMAQNKDYADLALAANPETILALIAENEELGRYLCTCRDCGGEGALHTGDWHSYGHMEPPEPVMEKCGECDGTGLLGEIQDLYQVITDRDQLKAENERLEVEVKRMTSIAYAAHGAFRMETMAERDQLRAENAGLKTGYEAYERVNAELKAEVELLRSLLGQSALAATTLRTDAEAYANHSGFNRGFVDFIRSISGVEVGHGYGSSKYPQQADVVAALGQGEQS